MTLVKFNRPGKSFSFVEDFLNEMPKLFNDDFPANGSNFVPVNIKETKDVFEVEMAAPGMKKDDFKVELDGNMLTISSERSEEHEENNGDEKFSRREFSYQSFQRSFSLPKDVVDDNKIEAHYEDGVLKLIIPKKEEAKQKPRRKIEIA